MLPILPQHGRFVLGDARNTLEVATHAADPPSKPLAILDAARLSMQLF